MSAVRLVNQLRSAGCPPTGAYQSDPRRRSNASESNFPTSTNGSPASSGTKRIGCGTHKPSAHYLTLSIPKETDHACNHRNYLDRFVASWRVYRAGGRRPYPHLARHRNNCLDPALRSRTQHHGLMLFVRINRNMVRVAPTRPLSPSKPSSNSI